MTNNKLRFNANKQYFSIIVTSRQRSKHTRFFPTNILSHSISPSDTVHNLSVTFDADFNFRKRISLTCRCCFYHIRDLIRRYIYLSVATTIATTLIANRLDYCNSLIYNLKSKDILKLQCVQNCLVRVVTRSSVFPFCPTPEISSLTPWPISHYFQTLHYCLSNSFFWRTFTSIPMLSLSPKPRDLRSSGFQLWSMPWLKTHAFQLLSLLFGIHSLSSHQIA